ncbi:gamma-glutamyltransferase family protein [uncultured Microbacterium sp.]|uniref:gamma-glutamyltransferase family protein n=1 Tax=uncultured Microbacterium sp. TaxID=191216 RepID=UPI0035CB525C
MTISQGSESTGVPSGGSGMGGGLVSGVFPPADAMRPTLYGEKWSVVAGHPLVTEVAASVLRRGGNATDAGVAGGFACHVVQVDMANLGGIAPILVREARSHRVFSVAGVGTWGRTATLEAVRTRFGDHLPLGGAPSIVPGAVAGWIAALTRFGTWSLADVLAPVIELASDGFPLDPRTAAHIAVMSRSFSRWPSSVDVYTAGGRPLDAGVRLVQPALGRLLQRLVDAEVRALETGADRARALRAAHEQFYQGDVARTIVDFVSGAGGFLEWEDLAGFEADIEPAPSVQFGDWDVHVTPSWSQGLIVAQALGILDGLPVRELDPDGPDYLHILVESLKLVFSERERAYGDPRFSGTSAAELLDSSHLDALRDRIGPDALPNLPTAPPAGPHLGSTTALVVLDGDGGSFAASPSDTLDGGPIIPELGIICSPRGVQSRLTAGHPNVIRPGGRPCVTPAAVIALGRQIAGADDRRVWATACPGGDVIVQAITQVMLTMEISDLTPQAAVERARVFGMSFPSGFHPHPSGERTVFVEAGIPRATVADLARRGHRIIDWPANEFDAGSVQTLIDVRTPSDGRRLIAAGADPRRTAYAQAR